MLLVDARKISTFEAEHGTHRKIGVWRDPVDRLAATYVGCIRAGVPHQYFWFLDLYGAPFERFVRFAEFELGKTDPLRIDPHVRLLSSTFGAHDVESIVDFEQLPEFLSGEQVRFPARFTPVAAPFRAATETDRWIRRVYQADEALKPS